ncbi:hypothetical protein [Anaeromicrobium sediminis]|uniref:Uncharacterized protein n=1 Tax=Anaeromicrobium sediminis TaxID=1478221 RepID=A0A267MRF7_9FIRM|nr:hypothetical protein [Anaeromicrobium sediminis]PAB61353.1 hypothetical protein CCE28_02685 [Anaeromicrobium sediminis]
MESNKIQFNFYDHIAILFPGSILNAIVLYYFPEFIFLIKKINELSSTLLIIIFIITSFIGGHICYALSKTFMDWVNGKLGIKFNVDAFKEVSTEQQDLIISEIEKIYETDFKLKNKIIEYRDNQLEGKDLGIKNLCFPFTKDDISNYYIFVSLADFQRSIAFLLLIICFMIPFNIFIYTSCLFGVARNIIAVLILFVFSILIFKRSIKMRKTADRVVYSQFLFNTTKNN